MGRRGSRRTWLVLPVLGRLQWPGRENVWWRGPCSPCSRWGRPAGVSWRGRLIGTSPCQTGAAQSCCWAGRAPSPGPWGRRLSSPSPLASGGLWTFVWWEGDPSWPLKIRSATERNLSNTLSKVSKAPRQIEKCAFLKRTNCICAVWAVRKL